MKKKRITVRSQGSTVPLIMCISKLTAKGFELGSVGKRICKHMRGWDTTRDTISLFKGYNY